MALTLCFIPYIFEAILAYIHFAMFCGMIIVNIFIKDAEPGNGNRTKVTRIFWIGKIFILSYQCSYVHYKYYTDHSWINWSCQGSLIICLAFNFTYQFIFTLIN